MTTKKKTARPGVELIKKFEGFEAKRYKCPAGVWTIGYGHTGPDVDAMKSGTIISLEEAERLLVRDLARFEVRVNTLVKVPIAQNQFDALVSFDFNTGALHRSTLLKLLNAGNREGAANEFLKWTRAAGRVLSGLVRRREEERKLFLTQ